MENKYYDHLKPKLPKQSFSDIVNEQLNIVQQQQQSRFAQELRAQKDQRKVLDAQQKQTLGFDVSKLSDIDKEVFAAKRDWLSDRINSFYYTGSKRGEFINDVNDLSNRFEELEYHQNNIATEKETLESYVSGTKQWTDKNLRLGDDVNSLNYKNSQWNNSGIDPNSLEIDPATGDAYGYYVDINGTRLKDESGADQFGPVQLSPTRGSKEYFSPTVTPYDNLFPATYCKPFASTATRIKKNDEHYPTLDEKKAALRKYVTLDASNNPSAVATARTQFSENYGEGIAESILQTDQLENGEQEGYIPMDMREYIDETMRLLNGNLMDSDGSGSGSGEAPKVFPSTAQFQLDSFTRPNSGFTGPMLPGSELQGGEKFGSGISTLMVPKSGVGKSEMWIESSYVPQDDQDPRLNEVSNQYKVLGVAVDESDVPNLFVRAEMYIEKDVTEVNEYLVGLEGVIPPETETQDVKTVKNIVVTTHNEKGERNEEYITILAQIGYAAGIKEGERDDAIKKGMEILRSHNDSEAQIFASMPTPNDESTQQAPNEGQQMMGDMQFANAIEPILIESQGERIADMTLANLLDYVKENPDQREEILQNAQNGNIPYIGSNGSLNYRESDDI